MHTHPWLASDPYRLHKCQVEHERDLRGLCSSLRNSGQHYSTNKTGRGRNLLTKSIMDSVVYFYRHGTRLSMRLFCFFHNFFEAAILSGRK